MPETRIAQQKSLIGIARFCCWALLVFAVVSVVLPAIGPRFPRGHRSRMRVAEVAAEISNFEMALTLFISEYGVPAPSSLTIREDGEWWHARDKANIRRIWPQFDFEQQRDINHDGDVNDVHRLSGAECLVFFLGGVSDSTYGHTGFSKNPRSPWSKMTTNRTGPFFNFDRERFTDVDNDGFVEYGDPIIGTPFLYVAPLEVRGGNTDLAVYAEGDSRNMLEAYDLRQSRPRCQIISTGEDGKYGMGGEYRSDSEFTGRRQSEADNILSFSIETQKLKGKRPQKPVDNLTTIFLFLILVAPMATLIILFLAQDYFRDKHPVR